MNWIGIGSGLATGFLMALALLCSGWAMRRTPGLDGLELISHAAVVMGLISCCCLPFVWQPELSHGFWRRMPWYLEMVTFYFLGQFMLFTIQKRVDSSRVVPLLGLKLPMLALLNLVFGIAAGFSWPQILAIALTVYSAFLLNNAGSRIPWRIFLLVLLTCLFFCLSDMGIKVNVDLLTDLPGGPDKPMASIQCTFISYICCGLYGAACLAFRRRRGHGLRLPALRNCCPYSVVWLASIVTLTLSFAHLDTVNGNILQATRGIFSILFAPILAACGLTYLEEKTSAWIVLRRLLAAILMIASVWLYNYHR